MDRAGKRAAISAYKERKSAAGVFAVRCEASAEVWVGGTPTLDTVQTRIWFSLRLGSSPHRGVQAAWAAHGESAFSFERLETYDEDEAHLMQAEWLKHRTLHWRAQLGAKPM